MFGAAPAGLSTQRLLPESIPLRFFGTAVIGHLCIWVGVVWTADEFAWFVNGIGPTLAVVHTLTVGVLLPTAMAASLQMLPVALGRPAPPTGACKALFILFATGGGVLIAGMAVSESVFVLAGATGLGLGMLIYVTITARMLLNMGEPRSVILHARVALIALIAAVAGAMAVAIHYQLPFLADALPWILAHATVAAYGFMGFLAFGFNTFLIPMFAMAEAPDARGIEISFWILLLALVLAVGSILTGTRWSLLAGLLAALAGSGLHLWLMVRALRTRMRRRLGPEFLLIGAGWVLMPVALFTGIANIIGIIPERGPMLLIFATGFGWLLTLLVGVLQRILPFLASMHTSRVGGRVAAPAKLTHERALAVHRWCHATAIVGVGAGVAFDLPELIRFGGLSGVIGAGAFGWFAVAVLNRTRGYLQPGHVTERPA
jgi:hypothetical protein